MARSRRLWQPGTLCCESCEHPLEVRLTPHAVAAGAGILPDVPGAVCPACLELVPGPVIQDLTAAAAAAMLLQADFELKTEPAVQVFLDLFGWQPQVVASAALRLHADGRATAAHDLLVAAAAVGPAGYFQVERASLLILDGETGQAHDLLLATGPDDHPCWHLHRGTLAYSVGRADAAQEHWRQQVESQPEEVGGWLTLGYFLATDGNDRAEAILHLEKAAAAFPDQPEFAHWLADVRARQAASDPRSAS